MVNKLSQIESFLNNNGFTLPNYIKLNESEIDTIYELLYKKKISLSNTLTSNEILFHGVYFSIIKKYDDMIKYYLMAINEGNDIAMVNLGQYYQDINDIDNMVKYYLMAIDRGNVVAINNLGKYYENINDIDNMLKYYLMAIDKGNDFSMNNLGYYYGNINDIDNMLKYYLMAINKGNSNAMNNLGYYYEKINEIDNMLKYYLMAIDKGNSNAMYNLGHYYAKINDIDNMLKYCLPAIENNYNRDEKIIMLLNKNIKSIKHLMIFRKYLDKNNLNKLNEYISDYLKIQNDLKLYQSNYIIKKECPICYETDDHIIFLCNHSVCYMCYQKLNSEKSFNCPLCRKQVK